MLGTLQRKNERLKKTGMVEAYFEDFRNATTQEFRKTYYQGANQSVYPFIIEVDGVVVMHPASVVGEFAPPQIVKGITSASLDKDGYGEFGYVWEGEEVWCVFKEFPEWKWIIGFRVPEDMKYRDASSFWVTLVYIMTGITLATLVILSLVVSTFTRPITKLTSAISAMAGGDLDQDIDTSGKDEVGALARSFSHMQDAIHQKITELEQENRDRQKAQADLANEKQQLAVTLRSIGDGVITTDTEGNIILLNVVAEELTGWSSEAASGKLLKDVFQLIDHQNPDHCENPVLEVMKKDHVASVICHADLVSRDGSQRRIASSGAPIRDVDGNVVGVVLVFRDVTEQVKTENELLRIKKIESIGVLAGGIAHDFNNILSAILGNINLALLDEMLLLTTRKRLEEAEKASVRAKDLTQQLLTFSRGGDPVKETAPLDTVIRDSAQFVLHGDAVACDFTIPSDLWLVDIDKGQISQVIQNMVLNGCHAMPDGGTIRIVCENIQNADAAITPFVQAGEFVRITIRDTGSGISGDMIDKIFDPYFTTKKEGSGLGLAICQSIISKHKGHISVASKLGDGTTFTIYLPASGRSKDVPSEPIPVSGDADLLTTKLRILLLEDEKIVRDVVEAMLERLGHGVVHSEEGQDAVAKYKEAAGTDKPFDLVIMDLTIPGGMGGKEAAQGVLAVNPDAKIVVSSGYSNDLVMANCQQYGFCASIVKPFKLQDLEDVIELVFAK
jgi:PAS domain S-box-containing protein